MKKLIYLLSFLSILFIGCNNNDSIVIDDENLLLGSWSYPEYSENKITYSRVMTTIQNEYTCTFQNDGTLTEHKNSSWCGTPPISYGNFTGSWNYENKDIINLKSKYWGGVFDVKWEIISLTENKLTVLINYSNL